MNECEKIEKTYIDMAIDEPNKLLEVLSKPDIPYNLLLPALEASIFIETNRKKLVLIIMQYIKHPIPAIRESAVFILTNNLTNKVRKAFEKAYEHEENEVVKHMLGMYAIK